MKNNTGMVLIHGAGLNSSIWDALIEDIKAPVLNIDFPNRMSHDHTNDELAFDDYVGSVCDKIRSWECDRFIIVAHSIGACVGLKVAEHFKKEVKGFIVIASVIPPNGHSFVSSLPFPQRCIMPFILKSLGTKPPQKSLKSELCNDLSDEQTQKIVSEFTPESKALYLTKINYVLPASNRIYIKLTNDNSMPFTLQTKMAKNLNADKIVEIDSGHLPMVSKPKYLGSVLSDIIQDLA